MKTPFIVASDISIRIGDKFLFSGDSWTMNRGEHWAFLGPNGSGKSTLAKALAGKLSVVKGAITLHFGDSTKHPYPSSQKKYISYLSFDMQRSLVEKEQQQSEFMSYLGKEYESQNVAEYIEDLKYLQIFGIANLSSKLLSQLSTGEMRKVLIAKAISQKPTLLILDEPFEGLDIQSKQSLTEFIDGLSRNNIHVLLITHHLEELLPSISHIMLIQDGHIVKQGIREDIVKNVISQKKILLNSSYDFVTDQNAIGEHIIEMKNVTVKYDNTIILNNVNWTMKSGENWLITGPNGAGKSTLVKLIIGDHSQVYSNSVKIFGHERGNGESIWDVKKNIGYISSDFHLEYREPISAYSVVLSGFFDSIGLYASSSAEQKEKVDDWFKKLQIEELKEREFLSLSLGQQRMILIMRAIIKSPKLLILDEPCHGLDIHNRQRILHIIDLIANSTTNIIYITHHHKETLQSITHEMHMEKGIITTMKH